MRQSAEPQKPWNDRSQEPTYVGGRRVPKSTDKGRNSSLRVDKAPGIQLSSRTQQPRI